MKGKYALLVIVIAAILAVAAFITISLWLRSPGTPAGEEVPTALPLVTGQEGEAPPGVPVEIDGVTVYLDTEPADAVRLKEEPTTPREPVATQPLPVPTETAPPQVAVTLPPPTSPPPPAVQAPVGPVVGVEPIIFIQYVVQANDTLYRITEKQETAIELMSVHGIDADDLIPGTTLTLPVANPNYCAASTPYVVRPGDTVSSIANRFNTTAERLGQVNNLGADFRIDIARVLCIA